MHHLQPSDYRTIFEAVPGLYLVLTPSLHIVAVSNAYLQATMTMRDDIVGRHIFEVFPDNPTDLSATGVHNLRASLERVVATCDADAMAVQKYDIRRPESEGGGFEVRYWSPINSPVRDASGKLLYIIHRVEDVTEFLRLKSYGQERDRLAETLQGRALEMEAEIYTRAQQVAEANRQLTRANDALANLYRRITLLLKQVGNELGIQAQSLDSGAAEPITPEEMLSRVSELIGRYKALESQLLQSQKMEAVGQLAGGVAHDFNNLLTMITGYVSRLKEKVTGRSELADLEEIEKAAIRAAAMTSKLLAFSRKQIVQPKVVNVNQIVRGMEDLLRRLIGENVALVTAMDSGAGNIQADPHQIEQVIMNLVVNARDAMPKGGRIVVETQKADLQSANSPVPKGHYSMISVTDTGQGMTPEIMAHIFEPYFTTKPVGRGTGLGLATVHGIVKQSGGHILVDSTPGVGSRFCVYFPSTDAAMGSEPSSDAARSEFQRSSITILVMEDDAAVRRLIVRTMSSAGYTILEARDGEEACRLALNARRIDLVLTDVVTPGMSGPDFAAWLGANRPGCPVLYMSGYDRELINLKELEKQSSFLPKPFTPQALLKCVSDLLSSTRAAGGAA